MGDGTGWGAWPSTPALKSTGSTGAALADHDVNVDRRGPVLLAEDAKGGTFRRAQGQGLGTIDQVLVAAELALGVIGQAVAHLALAPDPRRHRHVCLRQP